jgi:hypothetical protein
VFSERDSATGAVKPLAGADGEHSRNSGGSRAIDNGGPILIKLL